MINNNKFLILGFCLLTINIFGCREERVPEAVVESFIEAFEKEDCRKLSSILINYHELANVALLDRKITSANVGGVHILDMAIQKRSSSLVRTLLSFGSVVPYDIMRLVVIELEKNEDGDLFEILKLLLIYTKVPDYAFKQFTNQAFVLKFETLLFSVRHALIDHLKNYKRYCLAYDQGMVAKQQSEILKKFEFDAIATILKMAPDIINFPHSKHNVVSGWSWDEGTIEIMYPIYLSADYREADPQMLQLLLDAGANPDMLNGEKYKKTLLFEILNNRERLLNQKMFDVRNGLDADIPKIDSALQNNIRMITMLLKAGADVDNIQSKSAGEKIETAREFIQRQEWHDVLKLIDDVNRLRADKLFDVLEQDAQIPAEVAVIAAQYIDGKNENKYYYQV